MSLNKILIDGKEIEYSSRLENQNVIINIDGDEFSFSKGELEGRVFRKGALRHVFIKGSSLLFKNLSFSENAQVIRNESAVPMPGKIVSIDKNEGDKVKVGDLILKLEAMKMEHEIKAYKDGVLTQLLVKLHDQVESSQSLFEIE